MITIRKRKEAAESKEYPRSEIYAAIDTERDYQDQLWGGHNHDKFHEPEAWIMYMERYLDKAKEALSTTHVKQAYPEAMENMRKVVALGVACMENYGVLPRMKKLFFRKACPKCGGQPSEAMPLMEDSNKFYQVCTECGEIWGLQ